LSVDDEFWKNVTKDQKKETTIQEKPKVQQPEGLATDNPFASKTTEETKEETKSEIEIVKCGICGKDLKLSESKSDNGTPVHSECLINKTKEEVNQEKQSTQKTIDDPFSTSEKVQTKTVEPKTDNPFGTLSEVTTEAPVETPIQETTKTEKKLADPFVDKGQLSQKEEFERTKPASSGKNLSFMIFGKKGTSKTATAMSLSGRIFAISYDQQTKIIHEEFFNSDPRIEVWDGIEFFNSKDPETKLETAVKTVEYSNWLLENPCIKYKPDWILIDGTERLTHVCEMAMRAQENLLPYEGVKNRNAWKYRNDLINNIVQRASQIAILGVLYTAYTSIETVTTATGEEKREGPKWAGDIEQKTQIVIKTSSEKMQNGRAFVAEVESSKVSFIPTGRRIVVGERLNTGEIQNYVGIKGLFTPTGVKKYFSGGEQ